uniref:DNA repair/transcription protein mms19 n=1 Tax=Lygus hesperus TaxID=30085 RepID=A0A0A9X878_LYGHE
MNVLWPTGSFHLEQTVPIGDGVRLGQDTIVWMLESVVDMFASEKDPWNLLLFFSLISTLVAAVDDHHQYASALRACFTHVSCYFPITVVNTISVPVRVLKHSLLQVLLSSRIFAKLCATLISQCLRDVEEETRADACE